MEAVARAIEKVFISPDNVTLQPEGMI